MGATGPNHLLVRKIKVIKNLFFLLITTALAASCGGGSSGSSSSSSSSGSSSTSTDTTTPVNSSCAPAHEGNVVWTYSECGPLVDGETVNINQGTLDDSGVQLGSRKVNKGRVTFTFTKLDWSMIPWPTDDIVFMAFMALGQDLSNGYGLNNEVNWHILGNRFAEDGDIETRLVTQRFDGVCIPESIRYCEKKFNNFDAPKYDLTQSYKWDCAWDTTVNSGMNDWGQSGGDGLVSCALYNVTDANSPVLIETYRVPTSGSYEGLNGFTAGGNTSSSFFKPNMATTTTNFRFSIIE